MQNGFSCGRSISRQSDLPYISGTSHQYTIAATYLYLCGCKPMTRKRHSQYISCCVCDDVWV